jgi:RES domain-containing protein
LTAVWRIAYCPTPVPAAPALLQGMPHGSTLASGRWHKVGVRPVVYTAASRALCQLEKRVHCNGARPKDQALMRLELPKGAQVLLAEALGLVPDVLFDTTATQSLGVDWLLSGASLALSVPSVVEPAERNVLLNPLHRQYADIQVFIERQPFVFDERLFG